MQCRAFASKSVPVLGIGTWKMERDDRTAAIHAIRRAIDLGMTHVDTAELYGQGTVETLVADAIEGLRDRVFLVSKVLPQNASYKGTIHACEQSLARLRTDHLDCYLLHWRDDMPLVETFRAFEKLVEEGKIKAWGVSNFDEHDLAEAISIVGDAKISCNQVSYNLENRSIEDAVLPYCEAHGIAVVAYSPFGSGTFRSTKQLDTIARRTGVTPYQLVLRFLTRHRSTFAIPKSSNVAHVEELATYVDMDDATMHEIASVFPRVSRNRLSMQ